ncbi:transmembrane protease serine 13-like [Gigantopelta aegis]|uniref:transmembrane protease serine 13-like n=1 Tax=Gigantopelta aegis TaxID=1735272 RepID=UPI001B88CF99|nr:transmembrane protease serine 13-like [Gigantopelta aegis]
MMLTLWSTLCLMCLFASTRGQSSCGGKLDLVFLLDESESLGISSFQNSKNFIKMVANRFKIGSNDIQVGLDTFGSKPRRRFSLRQYSTWHQITAAIDNIIYLGSGTNTAAALEFVRTNSFSKYSGARDGVPKVAVVVTDGSSWDGAATRVQAQRAKHAGITILAVRVGSNVDVTQLNAIASNPGFVFSANAFQVASAIQNLVAKKPCNAQRLCGHAALPVQERIANGRPNGRCEWPWMVSVRDKMSPTDKQCGGVIVDRNKVITTADCARRMTSGIEVVIGENNIYKENEPLISSLVEKIIAVNSIIRDPRGNNIVVLKLRENIEYSACALPVCLPDVLPEEDFYTQASITQQCTMAGWGSPDNSNKRSKRLRTASAQFLGSSVCKTILSYIGQSTLPQNTACVQPLISANTPCENDDGGMVVCSRRGRWILQGLITAPVCSNAFPSLILDITSETIQEFINNA